MTQEKNLTLRSDLTITPAELIENASTQAKLLMSIVEQTNCYQTISGKKYLQVEAWETIGAFNRVHALTKQTNPIIREGEIVGYHADVELLKDGVIMGGASMPCFFTENACKGKEGDAKHKACMSAAQTFATSKAYRMNYSYVAILAGYQPTPAEEMTGEAVDDKPANLKHWCEEHKTKFFKRGKMKNYAHSIKGTDQWCNEPSETKPSQAPTSTPTKQATEGGEEQTGDNHPVEQKGQTETGAQVDADWLKETLGIIHWSTLDAVKWMNNQFGLTNDGKNRSLTQRVAELIPEERLKFVTHIQELKEAAGQ